MKTVPVIPKPNRLLLTDTDIEKWLPIGSPLYGSLAHLRLLIGNDRYDKGWCSSDLKAAIREELLDVMNYSRMMSQRVLELVKLGLLNDEDMDMTSVISFTGQAIITCEDLLDRLDSLPGFDAEYEA